MDSRNKKYANGERENAIDITREECRRVPIIHRILGGGGYSSRPHRRITTTDRKSSSGAGSQQRNKPLRGGTGENHGAAE
jgi:hypothetical protein